MAITYGLQVWDTQAFPLVEIRPSPDATFDLPKVNHQRLLLMKQHAAPTPNTLACAEALQQLSETLSSVHPWMKEYLQELSAQFRQQSTAVLTIDVPKKPSRFTILAYFVTMVASQHHMITYNAAGGFYVLPLPDVVSKSICPDLYNNLLLTVPSTDFEPFMLIYRNALIAEQLVSPIDLINWDEYPMSNDDREFEAKCMFEEKVAIYLKDKKITFKFNKKTKNFQIPVKQTGDIVFCLQFELSTAIQEQGIGRVMINSYISAHQKNFLELERDGFLRNVSEEFIKKFQVDFDDISISTPWRMFDLRTDFNPDCFQGFVCEYQKWSDFFGQIQSLMECSKKIISDTTSISDFLTVIEDSLSAGISLRDIIYNCDYSNTKKLATCYLMYAKLLRPSLFLILAKETRKLGSNMGEMVDYIQNYELLT
jgi:hypothetical protein